MSGPRHPEKVKNKSNPIPKKPSWIRVKAPVSKTFDYTKPIKIIDKRKTLLGIGFLNNEQTQINPKLVLNAK